MSLPFPPLEVEARKLGRPSQVLRLNGTDLVRLRRDGLTIDQADRLANRVGLHPANIWPDWYTHDLFDRLNNELESA